MPSPPHESPSRSAGNSPSPRAPPGTFTREPAETDVCSMPSFQSLARALTNYLCHFSGGSSSAGTAVPSRLQEQRGNPATAKQSQ